MRLEWNTRALGDIVSLIIDYRGKTPKKLGGDWSESGGYRALSAKNIKTGNIVQLESIRYLSADMYKKWMKDEIQHGDILITSEAPFGELLYWDSDEKIVLSQRLFALRCKPQIYPRYIYYFMTSRAFQGELRNRATGTTVTGLRQPELLKCNIVVPDLSTQQAIAEALSALDAKIANNKAINHHLEQIAQAIFKSWFVENVPDNWEYTNLGCITTEIRTKAKEQRLTVLSAVKTGNLIPSEDYFTKQVYSKDTSKYIVVEPNDFAYNPARVNIGSIGMNDFSFTGCVSPVYIVFRAESEYHHFLNFFIKSPIFQEEVRVRASGSVRQSLSYKDFSLIQVLYPSLEIVRKFNVQYENIFTSINQLNIENDRLTTLRDTLLPRLMSGELSVSDI